MALYPAAIDVEKEGKLARIDFRNFTCDVLGKMRARV